MQETESTAPETESQTEAQTDHAGSSDGENQAKASRKSDIYRRDADRNDGKPYIRNRCIPEKTADSKTGESDTEETTGEEEQEESDENLEELLVKDQDRKCPEKRTFLSTKDHHSRNRDLSGGVSAGCLEVRYRQTAKPCRLLCRIRKRTKN